MTRADALAALKHFIDQCLPTFGDYQDAMKAGAPYLYHALLSPPLNAGLLTAEEVCWGRAGLSGWGRALNCVEGFIRQILGWREYVRGVYWARMPEYRDSNALRASRDLPWFYWSGETELNCIANVVADTRAHAYAHHIQRLMVTGNFALIAGLDPAQVEAWYLIVFADAYEWVELPNVHGMVLWADGGVMGSKPYAASGAYIDRMSDYCANCAYDVKVKAGPKACPFNYLYWNFLIENEDRLIGNQRMAMPYRTLRGMGDQRRAEIRRDAAGSSDPSGPSPSALTRGTRPPTPHRERRFAARLGLEARRDAEAVAGDGEIGGVQAEIPLPVARLVSVDAELRAEIGAPGTITPGQPRPQAPRVEPAMAVACRSVSSVGRAQISACRRAP